ncbi:4Fe-4S binding protein [Candidatus Bipolaricaulota bacterium]
MTTYRIIVETDLCKGCGLCISYCPTNSLGLTDKLNRNGYSVAGACQQEACIGCRICENNCPDFAISVVGS